MKRTLSVLLLAGTTLAAMSAYAAPVFMLQFGSFETRGEADEKLSALKTKHAGVLSRMEVGVREVTLPPDNLTVYRTQAGPLATRADAQSVCSQLASNGDECYVVETAMMQPMTPPAQQVAAAEPAPAPASPKPKAEPVKMAAAEPAPAPAPPAPPAKPEAKTVVIEDNAPGAPVADAKKDTTTIVKGATVESAAKTAPAPVPPAPPAPVHAAAPAPAPMIEPSGAMRDPQNIAAMNRVTGSQMPTPDYVAPNPETVAQTEAMHRELAQAAEAQKAPVFPNIGSEVGVSPVTTSNIIDREENAPAPAPKKDRSLWDRMFGSDEDDAKPVSKPIQAAAVDAPVQAAPVEPIVMEPAPAPLPAPTTLEAAPPAAPVAMQPPPPPPPAAPVPAPAPVMAAAPVQPQPQPQPVAVTPVATQAAPFPLPPPPAPLTGMSRPAPVAVTPVVPAPMPVSAQPNMPQPTGVVPFTTAASPAANVRVEEAKRVPLTQTTAPATSAFPPMPPAVPVAPALPATMSPSATVGQKTLWAQVGVFPSQQAALAFWDKYRRANPDFPVVRVRVTSPLMAQQRGLDQVMLRVGPFGREAFINNLCEKMDDEGLQCAPITDMGVASNPGQARGMLPPSRYGH